MEEKMRLVLVGCISFILGALIGGRLLMGAHIHYSRDTDVVETAKRSVRDMEEAFGNRLTQDETVEHFKQKFGLCVEENSKLQREKWERNLLKTKPKVGQKSSKTGPKTAQN